MKKILPILTVVGCSALLIGCDAMMTTKQADYTKNINDFKNSVSEYNKTNPENITKTVGNYNLSIIERDNDISLMQENGKTIEEINNTSLIEDSTNLTTDNLVKEENNLLINEDNVTIKDKTSSNDTIANVENILNDGMNENDSLENNGNKANEQISTLYSLTNDIEDSCDEFCELKTKILAAIAESESLSEKLKNDELNLTREQRLFINEQSNQLKTLSRQLSNATNELSFNLSDLSAIMKENNQDMDALSLKYLIVLDNLINGNEMLQNGLSSLSKFAEKTVRAMFQYNGALLPCGYPRNDILFEKNEAYLHNATHILEKQEKNEKK